MSNNGYNVTLTFKGVKCIIQIIPNEYDCYQLLLKTNKPLSIEERSSLRFYLHEEGYIDEAFKVGRY